MVWTCLLIIRPGKNHLARHCVEQEEGEDKGSVGKTSESGQDWTFQSQRVVEDRDGGAAGCKIVAGAPKTAWVKGQIDLY